MVEFIEPYFEMPILPATVLLLVVAGYWLLMLLSGLDLDLFDLDLDVDVDIDGHESAFDWGLVGLKWFNLGDVPLMIWMSVFAFSSWLMAAYFDSGRTDLTTAQTLTSCLRNFGVGLFAAKALTTPLKGKLKAKEPNTVAEMIGRTCTVTTSEVTPTYGQASCSAEAAPLMIQVRTLEGSIENGQTAEIVDYSAADHVYYVRPRDQA